MEKPLKDSHFRMMAILFKIRDFFIPRRLVLKEVGIEAGFSVLDFGCGHGGYVSETAKLVGDTGKLFVLDHHPLAIESVKRIIDKKGLKNVHTLESDEKTGLPDSSVDMVLLFDVLHELKNPKKIFQELHRVLKPSGILAASDHHFKKEEMVPRVTEGDLFQLAGRGSKTFTFRKT
jgi:ubiquinone/menaquinone biosynthesis C-methylase UbiE